MAPRIQPISGSFLLCQATATNLNLKEANNLNSQSFSFIHLLIDPLPATSLVIRPLNSTSLELNWQNPIFLYDSLQIVCYLNEISSHREAYLNQTVLNNKSDLFSTKVGSSSQFLIINNLKPGANYNCTIFTVRYENEEVFSIVKSQTVKEMTSKLQYFGFFLAEKLFLVHEGKDTFWPNWTDSKNCNFFLLSLFSNIFCVIIFLTICY